MLKISCSSSLKIQIFKTIEHVKYFHAGRLSQGFEEFYDARVPGEPMVTGRAWTLADVRRKVRETFDDNNENYV